MKLVETRRMIAAEPASVWAALTNPARILAGDLGILRLEGQMVAGHKIRLESAVAPGRLFTLTVVAANAPRLMVWTSGTPGIFNGRRTFTLTPRTNGTEFHMAEVYKGLMLPLIWRSMPDMQSGFERFADGLKRMVEGRR
jgi:uncharacterized protein YndB with AHSA1/START domain